MSKPLGIGLGFDGAAVSYRVNPIDRVTDQVWDAVEAAVCARVRQLLNAVYRHSETSRFASRSA